jgi:hypothetical protein
MSLASPENRIGHLESSGRVRQGLDAADSPTRPHRQVPFDRSVQTA